MFLSWLLPLGRESCSLLRDVSVVQVRQRESAKLSLSICFSHISFDGAEESSNHHAIVTRIAIANMPVKHHKLTINCLSNAIAFRINETADIYHEFFRRVQFQEN